MNEPTEQQGFGGSAFAGQPRADRGHAALTRTDFVRFEEKDGEGSIQSRFARIAATCADRIAIKAGSVAVSYSELDALSNRIGGEILRRGGRRADPVAVVLAKDPTSISAILGVLKSGNFYLAFEPRAVELSRRINP